MRCIFDIFSASSTQPQPEVKKVHFRVNLFPCSNKLATVAVGDREEAKSFLINLLRYARKLSLISFYQLTSFHDGSENDKVIDELLYTETELGREGRI